jgi:preprotein translocase subunit SecY
MAGIANIHKIPELRNRLLFTLGILAVFRLGAHIPIPGIDSGLLTEYLSQQGGTIFGLLNTFTGGAFNKMTIFGLGIMPYITASIILQLLGVVIPYLEQLQKEGELGRKKINQYTRYLTVGLTAAQAISVGFWLRNMKVGATAVVPEGGVLFIITTMVSLTAGTIFIMWLGELITERGIGNGISLIIFFGIVARLPNDAGEVLTLWQTGQLSPFTIIGLMIVVVAVIAGIVFMERAQRRIPVQYPSRTVGRKMYKGVKTHLPLRINTSGVIPPIFASSLLSFPMTLTKLFPPKNAYIDWLNRALYPTSWEYNFLYGVLIIFFAFFYTAVVFNPIDVAENLKRHGGYIPGVRPGKSTSDYIDAVLTRITTVGALYITAVCILPSILVVSAGVSFWFGGTSVLIVVGVAMDTAQQIEAHLLARSYDGFLGPKGAKIKGRKR